MDDSAVLPDSDRIGSICRAKKAGQIIFYMDHRYSTDSDVNNCSHLYSKGLGFCYDGDMLC